MRAFQIALVGFALVCTAPLAAQMPMGQSVVQPDTTERIAAHTQERGRLATELADVIRLKNLVPPGSTDLPYYEQRERELVARIATLDSAGVAKPRKAKKSVSEDEVLGMIAGAVLGLFIANEINK